MRLFLVVFFAWLLLLPPRSSYAQVRQLYSNGDFTTGNMAKDGTTAPVGYSWSEVQNTTGNTDVSNAAIGFEATRGSGYEIADDFVVPAGSSWTVRSVEVFGLQTGYAGSDSPFTEFYFRIWKGTPNAVGSVVVYGDQETNRFSASSDALSYRIFNSLYPSPTAPNTRRRIWRVAATLAQDLVLGEGTYWLSWQTAVSDAGENLAVPVTVAGSRTVPGANALVRFNGDWFALKDPGKPSTDNSAVPIALAFGVYGTGPLPVELTAFTARRTAPGQVVLAWATASEKNNAGFTVEKSLDGRQWRPLGFVPGAGTDANSHHYAYTDAAAAGAAYYRLKQQDTDGKAQYTPVQFVPAADAPVVLTVYPNPAHGPVQIAGGSPTEPLRLFTMAGQLLQELPAGTRQLATQHLAPGVYLLRSGGRVARVVVQ